MHTWNVYNNVVNIHINKKQPWQKNKTNSKQTLLLWWANDIPFFNFTLQIICWINKILKYCVFLHLLIWLLNSFCKYRHILWFLTFDKDFQKKIQIFTFITKFVIHVLYLSWFHLITDTINSPFKTMFGHMWEWSAWTILLIPVVSWNSSVLIRKIK